MNTQFEAAHPTEIIRWAVERFRPDVAMTSSFGARSAALLHMAVQVEPRLSVRFVDTGLHFPETLQFKDALTKRLGLNLTVFTSRLDVRRFLQEHAEHEVGHPGFCCREHKVEATERALAGLQCWIAGIRRSESAERAGTPVVEVLTNGLVKVAPLAAWSSKQVHAYLTQHRLPYHPLWENGYTSIGCWPCTKPPMDPSDPRSGRWPGQVEKECGIHYIGKPPQRPSS